MSAEMWGWNFFEKLKIVHDGACFTEKYGKQAGAMRRGVPGGAGAMRLGAGGADADRRGALLGCAGGGKCRQGVPELTGYLVALRMIRNESTLALPDGWKKPGANGDWLSAGAAENQVQEREQDRSTLGCAAWCKIVSKN